MIQDILTVKIERNIYVNEEKAVSEIQILINTPFLLFSHHELLMALIMKFQSRHLLRVSLLRLVYTYDASISMT